MQCTGRGHREVPLRPVQTVSVDGEYYERGETREDNDV
jgi:hypothetical protein